MRKNNMVVHGMQSCLAVRQLSVDFWPTMRCTLRLRRVLSPLGGASPQHTQPAIPTALWVAELGKYFSGSVIKDMLDRLEQQASA